MTKLKIEIYKIKNVLYGYETKNMIYRYFNGYTVGTKYSKRENEFRLVSPREAAGSFRLIEELNREFFNA